MAKHNENWKSLKPKEGQSFASFVNETWLQVPRAGRVELYAKYDPKGKARNIAAYGMIRQWKNNDPDYEVKEDREREQLEVISKGEIEPYDGESFASFLLRTWDIIPKEQRVDFYSEFDPNGVGRNYQAYLSAKVRRELDPKWVFKEERDKFLSHIDTNRLTHSDKGTNQISKSNFAVRQNGVVAGTLEAALMEGGISQRKMFERLNLDERFYDIVKWTEGVREQVVRGQIREFSTVKFEVRPKKDISFTIESLKGLLKSANLRKELTIQETKVNKGLNKNKMVEIPLLDVHLNKLAESLTTNEEYNSEIAKERVLKLIKTAVAENTDAAKFILSVGQDFFNIDNLSKTTTGGTPQDVHQSYEVMVEFGLQLMVQVIDLLRSNGAEIEVIYVPGNHGKVTSWALTKILEAYYRGVKKIKINTSPQTRKYVKWGINLIGLAHGDKEGNRLNFLMQQEVPELWATTKIRELHLGHYHTLIANEVGGLCIRRLSSISGTDRWHKESGFIGSRIAGQIFIWDKKEGLHSIREVNFEK